MCNSCEAVMINSVICHEFGCPDAWKDSLRECVECGCEFQPESKQQATCSDECFEMYHGL